MSKALLLLWCCYGAVSFARVQAPTCDSIIWSDTRQLTWSDFRALPETTSAVGALSFISFHYQLVEENDRQYLTVLNYFEPCKSWYKVYDTSLSLQHEQVHFNIDEYIRRLFIKEVKELKTVSRFAFPGVRDVYFSAMRYRNFLHRRFDVETDYHRNPVKEEHWHLDISTRISLLEAQKEMRYSLKKPAIAAPQRLSTAQRSNYTVP